VSVLILTVVEIPQDYFHHKEIKILNNFMNILSTFYRFIIDYLKYFLKVSLPILKG